MKEVKSGKYLSDNFDATEVHDTEIAPLLTKLYGICRAHKIPCVALVCCGVTNDDYRLSAAISMPGIERTPAVLAVAGVAPEGVGSMMKAAAAHMFISAMAEAGSGSPSEPPRDPSESVH